MLRGDTILLRVAREDDLSTLSDLINDVEAAGDFWPVSIVPEPTLRKRYEENGLWGDRFGQMLICDLDNRVIGEIMFFGTVEYLDECEIAYRIFRPEDRGKGATSQALLLMTRFLFRTRNVNRLRLMIEPDNTASRRVAEKCGYQFEGTARGCLYQRGNHHDMDMFGILRRDVFPPAGT